MSETGPKNGLHPVEVVVEVKSMEMNLDHSGAFRFLLEDGSMVLADFTPLQWSVVESKHNRGRYKVKIVGTGDYADGQLQRIVDIDIINTDRVRPPRDPNAPDLWDKIDAIGKSTDWSGVPTDGAKNMHYYLYGRRRIED